jgi:hypothetical protein
MKRYAPSPSAAVNLCAASILLASAAVSSALVDQPHGSSDDFADHRLEQR